MGVYEKDIFKRVATEAIICSQINIAEIYFIVDGSDLHLSFYNITGNGSDILLENRNDDKERIP